MEDDPPMQLPFETHRYKGYVQTADGVRIVFPTRNDLWLHPEGATHLFINRAARELKRTTNRDLDRNNVTVMLIIDDDE
jgi:hypothetical protein